MTFPENCLRGIPNQKLMTEDGIPSTSLFFPMNNKLEVSINWEDDHKTIQFTLSMKKNNEYHFQYGVAQLPYKCIEEIKNHCLLPEPITVNREPLDGNPYHGNIIYREDLSKQGKKMVAGMLALKVSAIYRR